MLGKELGAMQSLAWKYVTLGSQVFEARLEFEVRAGFERCFSLSESIVDITSGF
jgi:hypothetical protein